METGHQNDTIFSSLCQLALPLFDQLNEYDGNLRLPRLITESRISCKTRSVRDALA